MSDHQPAPGTQVTAPSVSMTADDMLMVDFGTHADANDRVRAFWGALQSCQLPAGVRPVAGVTCMGFMLEEAAACSDTIDALQEQILAMAVSSLHDAPPAGRVIEIPVCYDRTMAPDLDRVADHCGISPEEVIRRHSSGRYVAQLIGFLPGFAYLGGLDPSLSVPRLSTPRPKVAVGALGITGHQCAMYPTASPGGWNLIGRSPRRLFDPSCDPPGLIQLGDQVRFIPITTEEFEKQWQSR
jgi:KipI family sensor histidine kinase inhibitor